MQNWHVRLYGKSVVKQLKMRYLRDFLGDCRHRRCLDLGGDNGIVSYLLRRSGGEWSSADIDERTVSMIKGLVGDRVYLVSERRTPFADASFDTVVIVDLLEHIHPDRVFLEDIDRILRTGGTLVVNVPHKVRFSPARFLRRCLGLTDEQHGHVREGYTYKELAGMLPGYEIERKATYSKFFTELVDMAVSAAIRLVGGKKTGSSKGTLVGEGDLKKHGRIFTAYSVVYPFMWLVSRCDALLFFLHGYRMVLRARKKGSL